MKNIRIYTIPLLFALSGCSIMMTPSKDNSVFYSLGEHSANVSTLSSSETNNLKALDIFIDETPSYTDCPYVVTTTGNNKINFSQINRWSSPFSDECAHALEEKIASLLRNKVTVISSTHSDGSMILCNYRISVSFDDFIYNEMEKCVVLKCSWSFFDFEKRQQIVVQKYNSSVNVENPDYDSIVNGMKEAIGKFAEYLSKQAELLIN